MRILRQLGAQIMPASCLLCEAGLVGEAALCPGCAADLPRMDSGCPVCGTVQPSQEICGRCQQQRPPYNRVVAAYEYAWPVDHLIRAFKYRDALLVARALTPELARQTGNHRPQAILPVPLHRGRLYRRGFNQSLIIAQCLHRQLGVPVDARLLERRRATREQAQLPPARRRRNVRGAFALTRDNPYRSVAIIDDVITTGTTVSELARLLRREGVKEIQIWALAKTSDKL